MQASGMSSHGKLLMQLMKVRILVPAESTIVRNWIKGKQ